MKGFDLTLTLIDDCVLSERAATEGGHAGLDYLPGATLLGAAAAKLYRNFPAEAFTLFHSGKVRFGNGLPVTKLDELSWPMPLSWYCAKGEAVEKDGHLDREQIWILGEGSALPDNKQPQQLRTGYVTTSGILVKPDKSLRMKTAINPKTGRARETALFGYDALQAGQTFRARISIDEDAVDEHLLKQLEESLSGQLLLGRSRSAEYGRVQTEIQPLSNISHKRNGATRITLWLLSDLAALDNLGQPALFPKPEWLGLPKGGLDVGDSYLRTRRYSPWNAERGGPDLERQVICQGSVLVFELESPLGDAHYERIAAGLGLYREAGLGQVWLNPSLLEEDHPQFQESSAKESASESKNSHKESPLIRWLKLQQPSEKDDFAAQARKLAREYHQLLISARTLKGLDNKTEVGPSRSQWSQVQAEAKSADQNIAQKLFDESKGCCKPKAPGWGDEHWDTDNKCTRSFAQWLRDVLGNNPSPHLVRHLAREVMDVIKKEVRQ